MEAKTKVQHIPIQTTKEQDENFFARAMNVKIGIIPLPVYLLLFALIVTFVYIDRKSVV